MGAQVLGGTKWKRFALVMVPTVAIAGGVTVMMANGVLAASFAVSGQQFKVSAESLHGTNFVQSGDVLPAANGGHAVAVAGIQKAEITKMCQSVNVPIPLIGDLTIVLRAGGSGKVEATNLVLDTNQVDASDAVFKGVNIGASAADVDAATKIPGWQKHGLDSNHKPVAKAYEATDFAQVVSDATLNNVKQTAYSTTAETMSLPGLSISAKLGGEECF
ncbi:MAG: cholesterol esterase [Catenulispora sp.]|nr:cholesterol esterase [Catenulispora sp.]